MGTECTVCMHRCRLTEGQTGRCRGRKNIGGSVVCDNYGLLTAMALDPIEKKPLRRFFSGSRILSVGSYGCNLNCPFCQNHDISMAQKLDVETVYVSPEKLVEKAEELKNMGNIGVAFTYNEPLISYEYVRDTSRLLKARGMKSVVVTNGSVNLAAAKEVLPWVDAVNIDLKGFTEEYYQFLGGDLETVKAFIRCAAKYCHVELTTLIVPGKNDSIHQMRELSAWVASADEEIPLHVTRFFPRWKMKELEATQAEQVFGLAEEARKRLNYVYTGNC